MTFLPPNQQRQSTEGTSACVCSDTRDNSLPLITDNIINIHKLHNKSRSRSRRWVTLSFAETKVSNSETKVRDLINMQNVLNHVSDRSSHLTGKCRIFFNFRRLDRGGYHTALSYDVIHDIFVLIKKGKVFPYSLLSVGPGADPGVQAVSPQMT